MKKSQKGFSAVEALLILIVLGILGFTGWFVYHSRSVANKAYDSQTTAQKSAAASTTDPYAGWKTYCDQDTNGCFRYPADWADLIRGVDTTALGSNKNETLTIEYAEPADNNRGLGDFLTKGINPLGTANKVVGGYYTIDNNPGYYLVDSSLPQELGLSSGKTTKGSSNELSFTAKSDKAWLVVHHNTAHDSNPSNGSVPLAQANAWFSTEDGKTALKIVKSYYIK